MKQEDLDLDEDFPSFIAHFLGAASVLATAWAMLFNWASVRTLIETRRAAVATTHAARTSIRTEAILKQMRADAIADARDAAKREAVMIRWTIAGVAFAALAFIAAVVAIVLTV